MQVNFYFYPVMLSLCLRFKDISFTEINQIISQIEHKARMELIIDLFVDDATGDVLAYFYPPEEVQLLYNTYRYTTVDNAVKYLNQTFEREVVPSRRKHYRGKRPIRYHKRLF